MSTFIGWIIFLCIIYLAIGALMVFYRNKKTEVKTEWGSFKTWSQIIEWPWSFKKE